MIRSFLKSLRDALDERAGLEPRTERAYSERHGDGLPSLEDARIMHTLRRERDAAIADIRVAQHERDAALADARLANELLLEAYRERDQALADLAKHVESATVMYAQGGES